MTAQQVQITGIQTDVTDRQTSSLLVHGLLELLDRLEELAEVALEQALEAPLLRMFVLKPKRSRHRSRLADPNRSVRS